MPAKFVVETSMPLVMTGVWMEVSTTTGKTVAIERVRFVDDEVHLDTEGAD